MISDARGGHVSPGVYTEERDVTYSAKSLGITSLGLAGETVKGPAFQNIEIKDWTEFVDYFGGTSPESGSISALTNIQSIICPKKTIDKINDKKRCCSLLRTMTKHQSRPQKNECLYENKKMRNIRGKAFRE
jgi:hypothetical protein